MKPRMTRETWAGFAAAVKAGAFDTVRQWPGTEATVDALEPAPDEQVDKSSVQDRDTAGVSPDPAGLAQAVAAELADTQRRRPGYSHGAA